MPGDRPSSRGDNRLSSHGASGSSLVEQHRRRDERIMAAHRYAREHGLPEASQREASVQMQHGQEIQHHATDWPYLSIHNSVETAAKRKAGEYGGYEAAYQATVDQLKTSTDPRAKAGWRKYVKEEVDKEEVDAEIKKLNFDALKRTCWAVKRLRSRMDHVEIHAQEIAKVLYEDFNSIKLEKEHFANNTESYNEERASAAYKRLKAQYISNSIGPNNLEINDTARGWYQRAGFDYAQGDQ